MLLCYSHLTKMHSAYIDTYLITFSFSFLFVFSRLSFKTAIFSSFLKVAIATSNFMNKVYDSGFGADFRESNLREIITLIQSYLHETSNSKTKLTGKCIRNEKLKSFLIKILNFLRQNLQRSYIFSKIGSA